MTADEFKVAVRRMFDSVRSNTTKIEEDDFSCFDVSPKNCPIRQANGKVCLRHCPLVYGDGHDVDEIFRVLETVENWNKEHPPVLTHKDKYEKMHGREPKDFYGNYICPLAVAPVDCPYRHGKKVKCNDCASKFWNSAYIEEINS